MNLSFLNDVTLDVVSTLAKPRKEPVVKTPEDTVDIRVFANGTIYPSKAFALAYDLEYKDRKVLPDGSFEIEGNGLDIFTSDDWGMVAGKLPEGTKIIFLSAVSKTFAKVDVWGATNYNEDNTPKASVFTQGAKTYGERTLVPMLSAMYGIDWTTTEHVDLKLSQEMLSSENGVYNIPKIISTGKNKGKASYVRREHIIIKPLIVADVKEKKVADPQLDMFSDKTAKAPKLGTV